MLQKSPIRRQPLPLLAPLSPDGERHLEALGRIRVLDETTVQKHVATWAKIAGLTPDDKQFRDDMAAALHSCLLECQGMWTRRSWKDLGEDFGAAAQHAAAAAEHLRQALPVLERLPLMWPNGAKLYDVTRRVRWPMKTARELEKLAAVARRNSERAKVSAKHAGKPVEAPAFYKLARGLVWAAIRANIKPKRRLELMKAVLKVTRKLPRGVIGASLDAAAVPATDQALGKYLSRIAAKFEGKPHRKNRT